jgi:thiamine-phosphate pyrophosphorylase
MTLRILDANLNRAREAARVLEDAARFEVDDAALCEALKAVRHELTAAAATLPPLPEARDTAADVGTHLWGAGERSRASIHAVAAAAGKRLSEALRSLEEFGKLIDLPFAESMRALRYRSYALEQRLLARLVTTAARQWRVCVLISESLCAGHTWEEVAAASLEGGADAIQLREKSLPDAELLRRARRLVALCGERAAAIINDRADIALLAEAQGVHLGQEDISVSEVRRLAGRRLLIGVSTHDLDEAARAIAAGADLCGVGAMYPSLTKERSPSGPDYLRAFVARHPGTPHLAIGGIDATRVLELVAIGCRGVAVSSCVCGAEDPASEVRSIVAALKRGGGPLG